MTSYTVSIVIEVLDTFIFREEKFTTLKDATQRYTQLSEDFPYSLVKLVDTKQMKQVARVNNLPKGGTR